MTTPILSANLAGTTLALPVSNVATTATLASGTGALFPSPSGGQYFTLTFSDTGNTIHEITRCTERSGDVVTITRGQEGTTALAWNAGDLAQNLWTSDAFEKSIDPRLANDTGAANVLVVTLNPVPFAYYVGMTIWTFPNHANTGAATINVNGLGAKNILQLNAAPLVANMLFTGSLYELVFDGTNFRLTGVSNIVGGVLTGTLPNPGMAAGAAVANIGYTPVNRAGDTMTGALTVSAGNITATAGRVRAALGAYLSGDPFAASLLLDYTLVNTGSPGVYMRFPNGFMIQMGVVLAVPGGTVAAPVTLPTAFPNSFFDIVAQYGSVPPPNGNAGAAPSSLSQFTIGNSSTSINNDIEWIAFGN